MATSPMKLFATAFLVLTLIISTGMVAEARLCESKSRSFKGPCVSDTNCGSVCRGERFSGGKCRGFRRRCFCTKHC